MIQAQHSIVSPAALLKTIQRHYPGIAASDCKLLALGCNDNFQIKGQVKNKRQDFVFRLYRLGWWPEADIDAELHFLEALQRRKVNACIPRRTGQRKRYISVETAEGRRYGALFTFLPGRPLGFNFGKRHVNMTQLGQLISQVHTVGDQLKKPLQRWTMDYDVMVTQTLQSISPLLEHRAKDFNYLQKVATRLESELNQPPEGALNFGVCHGDLHAHNVMLRDDGELAIFDFDWCGYSWRVYDLATVWWSLPRDKKGIAPWRAFLRGYSQHRKLSKQETQLLPWFVMLREFELLGFHLAMRKHVGDAWLNDNYYDFHMRFIKNWIKEHIGKL